MTEFEIQVSEYMKSKINDLRDHLNRSIREKEADSAKNRHLFSGYHLKKINQVCLEYISNIADSFLEFIKVHQQNAGVEKNWYHVWMSSIVNPEIEYARNILVEYVKNKNHKNISVIIDALKFDEGAKSIIRDNLFEFDKQMVQNGKEKAEEKIKGDNVFWQKIIAIGTIILAIVAIVTLFSLYHSAR